MTTPSLDKGKQRQLSQALQDSATDSTTDPSPSLRPASPSPSASTTASPRTTQRKTTNPPVRHGRGPIIRDSDDDDTSSLLPSSATGAATARRRRHSIASSSLSSRRRRSSPASLVCYALGILFIFFLVLLAVLHLWLGHLLSEQAKRGSLSDMAERGILFAGPEAVRLVQPSKHEGKDAVVSVEVDCMAGVDVRRALDWEAKDDDNSWWFRKVEGRIARWGVRQLDSVKVGVGRVHLLGPEASDDPLVVVGGLQGVDLPLSYPSRGLPVPTMDHYTLRFPVYVPRPEDLVALGKRIWDEKAYSVRIEVDDINVALGGPSSTGLLASITRRIGGVNVNRVLRPFTGIVPDLPGSSDPASLVNLTSYNIFQSHLPQHSNTSVIALSASADLTNPLYSAMKHGKIPSLKWGLPFKFPVTVSLPLPPTTLPPGAPHVAAEQQTDVLIAKLASDPFAFGLLEKHTSLSIEGHLVPAGNLTAGAVRKGKKDDDSPPPLATALSRFIARYLAGKENEVLIRYDPTPLTPAPSSVVSSEQAPYPPPIVGDLLSSLTIPFSLPGRNTTGPSPQLFRNLKIEDMKIKVAGMARLLPGSSSFGTDEPEGDLLCSGKVVGEVALPEEFKMLEEALSVSSIFPDVYVYDGALPPTSSSLVKRSQLPFLASSSSSEDATLSSSSSFDNDNDDEDLPTTYPPTPVPATAFARLHPSTSISATTLHIPANSTHNATTLVSATFVDAPLFLLPGRGDVFRRFVGKILFGGPNSKVKAGVRGVTAVEAGLGGWGEVGVEGIEIEGEFFVGSGGVEE